MDNPFSWDYLTTVPETTEVFGPFAIIYLIIFGFGFLASIYIYNDGARRYGTNAVQRRAMQRGSAIAMAVFGAGLFFFGMRILQINPFGFGMRIWLWISLLAVVVMVGYFAYYFRTAYQEQLKAWQERQVKQQYMRPAHAGGGAVRIEPRKEVRRRRR
jgi:uncharacterized membrane protein